MNQLITKENFKIIGTEYLYLKYRNGLADYERIENINEENLISINFKTIIFLENEEILPFINKYVISNYLVSKRLNEVIKSNKIIFKNRNIDPNYKWISIDNIYNINQTKFQFYELSFRFNS